MLSITWKGATTGSVQMAPGQSFALGAASSPDVFAFASGNDGLALVLGNGLTDKVDPSKARGPLTGSVMVSYGGETRLPLTPVVIHDGGGKVLRFGTAKAPAYLHEDGWDEFWMRDAPGDPLIEDKIMARLDAMDLSFDETAFQNPDQSGSKRVSQSAWPGTLLCAMPFGHDTDAMEAALAWTDFQLEHRHALFYDASGKLLRAAECPWWRQGPKGWTGSAKRPSASPYQLETVQHMAPDRHLLAAVGFGDGPAKLYAEAYMECCMTWPEYKGQLADDQRSAGYAIRTAALYMLAFPMSLTYNAALLRAVGSLRSAFGFASTGEPYPSIAPAHTGAWSHGYPSLVDWLAYAKASSLTLPGDLPPPVAGGTCDHLRPWLAEEAKRRGFSSSLFTDGPIGLWQGHVIVWQTAVILGALCAVRDIPDCAALVPDIHKLIQHVTACIVGPGMSVGIGPDGQAVIPNPVVDAYTARNPRRVMKGPGKNSTTTWIIAPLLAAEPSLGPALKARARAAAKQMWFATDYPSPPDIEVSGLLPIKLLGLRP